MFGTIQQFPATSLVLIHNSSKLIGYLGSLIQPDWLLVPNLSVISIYASGGAPDRMPQHSCFTHSDEALLTQDEAKTGRTADPGALKDDLVKDSSS
ncbi:hypothetical protein GDO78_010211 [Eleutherodactylus coqui]|uniref:Uncharacterized protein n=1 Tax=Eleutherodactylus coqui TaxID=57060 RepID=A0A8J6F4X3_ELECQ|nr:hypothetical protein GDO78_010211 [Eleutherodactylus coqui]